MARKETFIAFWQGFLPSGPPNGPALDKIPADVAVVNLAFGSLFRGNMVCTSYLQVSNTFDSVKAGIRALQQRGTKVLLSILPAAAPRCGWDDVEDPDELAAFINDTFIASENWHLDGVDIDGEPIPQTQRFVDVIVALRKHMGPNALITYEAYTGAETELLRQVRDQLNWVNLMAYTPAPDFDQQVALFETYGAAVGNGKVAFGVAAPVRGTQQGTPLPLVQDLSTWEPRGGGRKKGVMLYSISNDLEKYTGKRDMLWTDTVREYLP